MVNLFMQRKLPKSPAPGRHNTAYGGSQRVCLCPMAVAANNWAGPWNTSCASSHEYQVLKTSMRSGLTCIFCSKLIQSKVVGKGGSIFRLTSKHSLMLTATPNMLSYIAANKHGHWFIIDIDRAAKQSLVFPV